MIYFVITNIVGWIISAILFALLWRFRFIGKTVPDIDMVFTKIFIFIWPIGIIIGTLLLITGACQNIKWWFPNPITKIWKKIANLPWQSPILWYIVFMWRGQQLSRKRKTTFFWIFGWQTQNLVYITYTNAVLLMVTIVYTT